MNGSCRLFPCEPGVCTEDAVVQAVRLLEEEGGGGGGEIESLPAVPLTAKLESLIYQRTQIGSRVDELKKSKRVSGTIDAGMHSMRQRGNPYVLSKERMQSIDRNTWCHTIKHVMASYVRGCNQPVRSNT